MNTIGRYISSGGVAGAVAMLSMTLSMVGVVASVLISRVGPMHAWRHRALRIARAAALVGATSTCLATFLVVQGARKTALEGVLPGSAVGAGSYAMRGEPALLYPLVQQATVPASLSKVRVPETFVVAMDSQLFVFAALSAAGIVLLLTLLILARTNARAGFASALVIAAPVLVTMIATLFICAAAYVHRDGFAQCLSGLCPSAIAVDRADRAFHETLAKAARSFTHAEVVALATALLCAAVACFSQAGRKAFHSPSRWSLLLLVAALPVSSWLYLSSRDLAADANALVQPDHARGSAYQFPGTTPALRTCQEPISQFDLVFFPTATKTNAAEIWAMDVKPPGPSDYAEYASTMKRNWLLMHGAVAGRAESGLARAEPQGGQPPTDTLAIVADSHLPVTQIVPWLRAAIEGAGIKRIQVVSQTVTTRDAIGLRNLRSVRFCGASIRLDPQGTELGSLSTWGDVARVAAGRDAALQVPSGR